MKKILVSLVLAALVGTGAVVADGVPVQDAVAIALDKEKAVEVCGKLLKGE